VTYRETSRIAYQAANIGEIAQRVLEFIQSAGQHGATCDEAMATLGLTHQSASPRFTDLEQRGLIVRTQNKRNTRSGNPAAIYVYQEFPDLFSRSRPGRTDAFRAVIRAALAARTTGNWDAFDSAFGSLPDTERRRI
jgi:hypothetical protein